MIFWLGFVVASGVAYWLFFVVGDFATKLAPGATLSVLRGSTFTVKWLARILWAGFAVKMALLLLAIAAAG